MKRTLNYLQSRDSEKMREKLREFSKYLTESQEKFDGAIHDWLDSFNLKLLC